MWISKSETFVVSQEYPQAMLSVCHGYKHELCIGRSAILAAAIA